MLEKRREILTEKGGDFAGGALLGLVYSTFIFLIKQITSGRISETSSLILATIAVMLLSWLSRVFFASFVFVASYVGAGIIASLLYNYYNNSYFLLYTFLLGSFLGYLLSILEVSIGKMGASSKSPHAEERTSSEEKAT